MKLFDAVPARSIPANAITCAGLLLGVAAIGAAFREDFSTAAWFIAMCALIDKMDGSVARLMKATSDFGIQMDSFSDLVTFGLAPASLVWCAAPKLSPEVWGHSATWGAMSAQLALTLMCSSYVVCAALRLAKFNVTTSEHPTMFHGLPTTLAGGLTATLFLTSFELGWQAPQAVAWFPWLLLVCAAMMVSNLPLPKLRRARSSALFAGQVLLGVAIYVLIPMRRGFWLPLLVLVGYVLIGFGVGLRHELSEEHKA